MDQETCLKAIIIGDDVELLDKEGGVWIPGRVTSTKPLEAKPDGWAMSFPWKWPETLRRAPAEYSVNDAVQVKDHEADDWSAGKVTSTSPLEVERNGWSKSFTFLHVRKKDWKAELEKELTVLKQAQEDFNAASSVHVATVAKNISDEAQAAATRVAAKALDLRKVADEAAAKAKTAKVFAGKKVGEAVAANKSSQIAEAKKASALGALREANAEYNLAEHTASENAVAAKIAQAQVERKKAALEAAEKEDAEEAALIKHFDHEAQTAKQSGNPALVQAMEAAAHSARVALNTTHKLVDQLKQDLAQVSSLANEMASANSVAQKIAAAKLQVVEGSAHDEASQEALVNKSEQKLDEATEEAKQAMTAAKSSLEEFRAKDMTALQAAHLRKQLQGVADKDAKDAAVKKAAAKEASIKEQQSTNALKAAIAAAKAKGLSEDQVLKEVSLEAAGNYNNFPLLAFGGLACVGMTMGVALWSRTRVDGTIVMPEDLLG